MTTIGSRFSTNASLLTADANNNAGTISEAAFQHMLFQKALIKICDWFSQWQPWQQRIMLQGVIERSSTEVLKSLASSLEPILHRDFLTALSKGEYPTEPLRRKRKRLNKISLESVSKQKEEDEARQREEEEEEEESEEETAGETSLFYLSDDESTSEKKGGGGGGGEKKKKKKGKKALESPKMNVVTVFTGLLSRLKKIREENIVKREFEVRQKRATFRRESFNPEAVDSRCQDRATDDEEAEDENQSRRGSCTSLGHEARNGDFAIEEEDEDGSGASAKSTTEKQKPTLGAVARRRSSKALLGQLDVKLLERKLSRIESDGTLIRAQGQVVDQGRGQSGGASDGEGEVEKTSPRARRFSHRISRRQSELNLIGEDGNGQTTPGCEQRNLSASRSPRALSRRTSQQDLITERRKSSGRLSRKASAMLLLGAAANTEPKSASVSPKNLSRKNSETTISNLNATMGVDRRQSGGSARSLTRNTTKMHLNEAESDATKLKGSVPLEGATRRASETSPKPEQNISRKLSKKGTMLNMGESEVDDHVGGMPPSSRRLSRKESESSMVSATSTVKKKVGRVESNASLVGGKASKQSSYKRNETGLFEGGSTSAAQTIKSKFKRTRSKGFYAEHWINISDFSDSRELYKPRHHVLQESLILQKVLLPSHASTAKRETVDATDGRTTPDYFPDIEDDKLACILKSSLVKETLPPLPHKENNNNNKCSKRGFDRMDAQASMSGIDIVDTGPIELAVTDTAAAASGAILTGVNLPGVEVIDAEDTNAAAPEVLLRVHPAAESMSSASVVFGSGVCGGEAGFNRRQLPPVVGLPAANGKLKKVNRKEMQKRFKEQLAEVWLSFSQFKSTDKIVLMMKVIKLCKHDLVVFFGSLLYDRFFNKANIESPTDGVLMKIFGYLDYEDLASVSQVCSRWNHLVKLDDLWIGKFNELGKLINFPYLVDYLQKNGNTKSQRIDWRKAYLEILPYFLDPDFLDQDLRNIANNEDARSCVSLELSLVLPPPAKLTKPKDKWSFRGIQTKLFGVFHAKENFKNALMTQKTRKELLLTKDHKNSVLQDPLEAATCSKKLDNSEVDKKETNEQKTVNSKSTVVMETWTDLSPAKDMLGVFESGVTLLWEAERSSRTQTALCTVLGSAGICNNNSEGDDATSVISSSIPPSTAMSSVSSGVVSMSSSKPSSTSGASCLTPAPSMTSLAPSTTSSFSSMASSSVSTKGSKNGGSKKRNIEVIREDSASFAADDSEGSSIGISPLHPFTILGQVKSIQKTTVKKGHSGSIQTMVADEEHLFTGGKDRTIRIWNRKSMEVVKKLHGHKAAVSCLGTISFRKETRKPSYILPTPEVVTRFLVSAGEDGPILIWDLNFYRKILVLDPCQPRPRNSRESQPSSSSSACSSSSSSSHLHSSTIKKTTFATCLITSSYSRSIVAGLSDGGLSLFVTKDTSTVKTVPDKQTFVIKRLMATGLKGRDISLEPVTAICWAKEEQLILAATGTRVQVFDFNRETFCHTLESHRANISSILCVGDLFLSGDVSGLLFLHEVSTSGLEAQAAINVNETPADVNEGHGQVHKGSTDSWPINDDSSPTTDFAATPTDISATPTDVNMTPIERSFGDGEDESKKVVDLDFWDGRMFTLSGDNNIREWNLETLTCLRRLALHGRGKARKMLILERGLVVPDTKGNLNMLQWEGEEEEGGENTSRNRKRKTVVNEVAEDEGFGEMTY